MNEEKMTHQVISDVFHITNESTAANAHKANPYGVSSNQLPKTFMYEFSQEGQMFGMADLDIILCNRLMKNKDENKFAYLYQAYEKLENHLWAKRKGNEETVKEIKSITARYFVTCLSCPDTFELNNENVVQIDLDKNAGPGGVNNLQMMQAMMMQGGGISAESLSSNLPFTFSKM